MLRTVGRLARRVTKVALLATAVGGLLLVLDAIFLDDQEGESDGL
jgi:hypothetical protein